MLQDVRAVGMAALQLPRVLREGARGTTRYLAERNARYPMLLVHGYAATDSVWTPLRRALGQAGFGHIIRRALAASTALRLIRTETLADPVASTDAGRELMAA